MSQINALTGGETLPPLKYRPKQPARVSPNGLGDVYELKDVYPALPRLEIRHEGLGFLQLPGQFLLSQPTALAGPL